MESLAKIRQEAVGEIFLIFAEFFKYPTAEFFSEISSGNIDKQLAQLFKRANFSLEPTSFQTRLSSNFKEFKKIFARCFLGIFQPFAAPIESVYKVWTTDPTARTPIAKSKGYVMGDSALHIQHLLQQFGLEIPEEYKMMPDHLTIILELYSFLNERCSPQECEIFINDHLDWLADFKQALTLVKENDFFLNILDVLQKIINEEKKRLVAMVENF